MLNSCHVFISYNKDIQFIQIVSGPDNLILYSTVMWPGAVHDSCIFKESALRRTLECGKVT